MEQENINVLGALNTDNLTVLDLKNDNKSIQGRYNKLQQSSQMSSVLNYEIQYSQHQKITKNTVLQRPQTALQTVQTPIRSTLLDWENKVTIHEKRDLKKNNKKGLKIYSNGNKKKEKSDVYWTQTKVNTCSYIFKKAGKQYAVPLYQKPERNLKDQSEVFIYKSSLMQEDFGDAIKPRSKVGDRQKPLCKYDPKADRNLLPQEPTQPSLWNVSQIKF